MITVVEHGRVRELSLSRRPVNAINPDLVAALRSRLREARQDGCAAIMLSGRPGCFSAGLDVPELLGLDRTQMRAMWQDFFALLSDVATSDIPIGTALTGHSPAGGAVIAICADTACSPRENISSVSTRSRWGYRCPRSFIACSRTWSGHERRSAWKSPRRS